MAAGTTRISDIVEPENFTPYMAQLTEEKSRIIQSGVAPVSDFLNDFLRGGGRTVNVPSFQDLDNDDARVSTDDPHITTATVVLDGNAQNLTFDPTPQKIGTSTEIAVRLNRNQSWSSMRLATILAGADPQERIAERVSDYWVRQLQRTFIATWNGILADNTTNDSGDYSNDVSGVSFIDGVTNFTAESFIDTTLTMGDSMEDLNTMFVHSVVYARMQKNNLIDFIVDSEGRTRIPTFLEREVIVDDSMPATGNVYDCWLFGENAAQFGSIDPDDATEVERKAGAGNGSGQDVLYSRVQWVLHPTGHAYTGTAAAGGPANDNGANNLQNAASWDRRYPERKQIKFARLRVREA